MPYDIRVIRSTDCVRLDASGEIDLPTSRQLLSDAIWACVHGKIGRVLLDLREAVSIRITMAQLASLAQVCREASPGGREHKIAIIGTNNPPVGAEYVASLAQNEGWNIEAFGEFEPAFMWLAA
jgi:hypothetical protein